MQRHDFDKNSNQVNLMSSKDDSVLTLKTRTRLRSHRVVSFTYSYFVNSHVFVLKYTKMTHELMLNLIESDQCARKGSTQLEPRPTETAGCLTTSTNYTQHARSRMFFQGVQL